MKQLRCYYCRERFRPRDRSGGKAHKYCSVECRRKFATIIRRWGYDMWLGGSRVPGLPRYNHKTMSPIYSARK